MSYFAVIHRRLHWLNLPGALLIALLQRTPIIRVAASAGNFVFSSTAGNVLKAAASTLGALGAVHSMAGATTLSASTPSPASGTVGTVFNTVVFSVKGAQSAASSWTVNGGVPPGLSLKAYGTTTAGVTSGLINNASTLQLDGTPTSAGQFLLSLTAWESAGAKNTSTTFTYVINIAAAPNSAPTISTQPTSKTVPVGGTAQFTSAASGSPTPTLQWFKGSTAIAGATSTILTISGATSADAATYTLVATNSQGSATSNAVTLTVTGGVTAPVVTAQPASITAAASSLAVFTVVATGSPTYQWRKNGTAITGATNDTLTFAKLAAADTACYDVVVSNSAGTTIGGPATLLVTSPYSAYLSNLAVRTTLSANQILIVGLTMSGGKKDVLLRAAGPGLGALGVPGTMADPKLALYNGSTQIASNDNWQGNAAVSSAISTVGAFAFPSANSLDAALVANIEGGRTVQVSGPAAGNVIVETYDAGSGYSTRLTNLSALNFVGTGGDILIAGFTVAGSGSRNLLIRAAGPSLGALGVPATIADPKLELFTAAGSKIAENDSYAASLNTIFTSVGAFAFVPNAKDAALIVSLPPGGYTVQVSGADGGTGVAIVEVYELP
jgi:hypothetical protein